MADRNETQPNSPTRKITVESPAFVETEMFPYGITDATQLDKALFDTWFLMTFQGPAAFEISSSADPSQTHHISQACLIDQNDRVYIVGMNGIIIPATNEFIPLEYPDSQKLIQLVHEDACNFQSTKDGPVLQLRTVNMDIPPRDIAMFEQLLKQTYDAGLLVQDDDMNVACESVLTETDVVESDVKADIDGIDEESPAPQKKTVWEVFQEAISTSAQHDLEKRMKEIEENNQAFERASKTVAEVLVPYTITDLRKGLDEEVECNLRQRVFRADTPTAASHGSVYYALRRDMGVSVSQNGDEVVLTYDEYSNTGKPSTKKLTIPAGLSGHSQPIFTRDTKAADVCDAVTALQSIVSPGYRAERIDAVALQLDDNPQISLDELRVRIPAWVSEITDTGKRAEVEESIQNKTWALLVDKCNGNDKPIYLTASELTGVMERCKAEYHLGIAVESLLKNTTRLTAMTPGSLEWYRKELVKQLAPALDVNRGASDISPEQLVMNYLPQLENGSYAVTLFDIEQSTFTEHSRDAYDENALGQSRPLSFRFLGSQLTGGLPVIYDIGVSKTGDLTISSGSDITTPTELMRETILVNVLLSMGVEIPTYHTSNRWLHQDGVVMATVLPQTNSSTASGQERVLMTTRNVAGLWESHIYENAKDIQAREHAMMYEFITDTGDMRFSMLSGERNFPILFVDRESDRLFVSEETYVFRPDSYTQLVESSENGRKRERIREHVSKHAKFAGEITSLKKRFDGNSGISQGLWDKDALMLSNCWAYTEAGISLVPDNEFGGIDHVRWDDASKKLTVTMNLHDLHEPDGVRHSSEASIIINSNTVDYVLNDAGNSPNEIYTGYMHDALLLLCTNACRYPGNNRYVFSYLLPEQAVTLIDERQHKRTVRTLFEYDNAQGTVRFGGFSLVLDPQNKDVTDDFRVNPEGDYTFEYSDERSYRDIVLIAALFDQLISDPNWQRVPVLSNDDHALCASTVKIERGVTRTIPDDALALQVVWQQDRLHLMLHLLAVADNGDADRICTQLVNLHKGNGNAAEARRWIQDILNTNEFWVPVQKHHLQPHEGTEEEVPSQYMVQYFSEDGIVVIAPHWLTQTTSGKESLNDMKKPEHMRRAVAYDIRDGKMVCLGKYQSTGASSYERVGDIKKPREDYLLRTGEGFWTPMEVFFSLGLLKDIIRDAIHDEYHRQMNVHYLGKTDSSDTQSLQRQWSLRLGAKLGDLMSASIMAELGNQLLDDTSTVSIRNCQVVLPKTGSQNGKECSNIDGLIDQAVVLLTAPFQNYWVNPRTRWVRANDAPETISTAAQFAA